MGGDNQQTDDQFIHLLILYRVLLIALFSPTVIGAPALLLTFVFAQWWLFEAASCPRGQT
jgi:hypothetical protein